MRPWFTVTIIAIIAGCLLSFWLVIDFALLNRVMFETPFTVTVRVPFMPSWSYRWAEVQFMYILTISVLLGAGIVALTTLIFDTKRTLKVRKMRKELVRLQKSLEEAQAKLPPLSVEKEPAAAESEPVAVAVEPSTHNEPVTPDDITHSFEDVVEHGDFLKVAQKRIDDELAEHHGRRPEGDIRAIVTGSSEEATPGPIQEESSAEIPADIPTMPAMNAPDAVDSAQETTAKQTMPSEEVVSPTWTEEADPVDDSLKHDPNQEMSGPEQNGNTQLAGEQEGKPVDEAEIVRHADIQEAESGTSPLKKPPSESQPQSN